MNISLSVIVPQVPEILFICFYFIYFIYFLFFKDFIYLFDRDSQPAREGTQAGGVGEEEAGS